MLRRVPSGDEIAASNRPGHDHLAEHPEERFIIRIRLPRLGRGVGAHT
jgi:hypothetical protein